jgi:hypothetical protein
MAEEVATIHRVLSRGSSFPSLVESAGGRLYVMKLSGAGQGERGLAGEFISTRLAGALGLNVPAVEPILLPAGLPWQTGTDEFYESVQRSVGWNLGVAFIAQARDVQAADLPAVPDAFLAKLAAADALLQNVDRTLANPNLLRDEAGTYWAIDFGACLLIERLARGIVRITPTLPRNHFLAGDARFPTLGGAGSIRLAAEQVEPAVAAVPEDWIMELGTSRRLLTGALTKYLHDIGAAG